MQREQKEITIKTDGGTEFTIPVEVFEDENGNRTYSYHSYQKALFNSVAGGTFEDIRQALDYIQELYTAFEDSGFEIVDWSGDGWYTFQKEGDEQ